jgi:hypothetical protein
MREESNDVVKRLDRIERRFEILTLDVAQVRADQRSLEDRMDDLERRPD